VTARAATTRDRCGRTGRADQIIGAGSQQQLDKAGERRRRLGSELDEGDHGGAALPQVGRRRPVGHQLGPGRQLLEVDGEAGVQGLGGIPVAAAPVGQLPLGEWPNQGVTVVEGEPAGELLGEQQGAGKLVLAERLADPVLGQGEQQGRWPAAQLLRAP